MVPCGEIFQQRNLNLKFNVFQFHKKFDLLLGLDNLKILKANIDLNSNYLKTPKLNIPLLYLGTDSAETYTVDARTIQQIKIRIRNLENGDAILPYMRIGEMEVPECLVRVDNHETNVRILNPKTTPGKFSQISPVEVEIPDELTDNIDSLNNYYDEDAKFDFDISKLRMNHMNEEEKALITNLILKYSDVFHNENQPLSFTNKVKHTIRTTDEIPVYARNYRFPEIYREEVDRQIEEMLEQGIVKHSDSPWNAPIWIVPKKADASGKPKFRIVVDYRKLNEKTIEDKYPLPQISELLDKLGRCQYFSVIDLKSGFHQIEMSPESIEKTAFSTPSYHLEFHRLPFGLRNSPSTFQRLMDNVLRGITNEFCCVYLDDIIVYSTSLPEHINRLEEIFKRLREANLKIQLDKTEFLRKEIAYLGHVITPNGVKPNPEKIKAIQNYPIPTTSKEIKSFLGLLGYYRKFIQNFAKITKPMTRCLKKGCRIDTKDPEYVEAFETCKTLLTNEPILQYPDFSKLFHLTTDASNVAIGAVLSQTTNGADLPIAYASRTLCDSERRLSTIERELLAVVWGVQYFRPYLFGRKFKIHTDHRPLQWLYSIKEPGSKLFKWRTKLSAYDFDIVYKKGTLNSNVDALSRIELLNNNDDNESIEGADEAIDTFFETLSPKSLLRVIDKDIETPASIIVNFDSDEDPESEGTIHSNAIGHATVAIPIRNEPINNCKNQIIIKLANIPVENPVKVKKLFENKSRITVHIRKHNLEQDIIKFVKEYVQPKIKYGLYFTEDIYEQFCNIMTKNFAFSEITMTKYTKRLEDVLDENKRPELIRKYHEGITNHRGIDETHNHLKRTHYWPNMRESIQRFINNCNLCVRCKYDRNPIKVKYNVTPTASRPLETVHMDKLTLEGSKFLTIIDSFSRHAQAYPLKSSNAIDVVESLLTHFCIYGIPINIVTDNGPEFQNSVVREFMLLHNINLHFTSSQHPDSNGLIERFHSTLIEHIRILNERSEYKKSNMNTKVKYALLAYNNSIHSTSKLTPFELLYGHIKPDTLLDLKIDQVVANNYLASHKDKMTALYAQVKEKIHQHKEKAIEKKNENREEIPKIPPKVYVKTVQKQSKTKPKFKEEMIKSINPELKTALIVPRHHNTIEKIHLSNVHRPKKFTDSVANAWDPKADKKEILALKFGLKLTRADLITLKDQNWVNDMVINLYMELIDERNRSNQNLPKSFSFNTFLYVSFKAGGYERVKNYTRKSDIFDMDIVLVPIFKSSHWRLIEIRNKTKQLNYYDSLSMDGTEYLNDILKYLEEEHLAKKGTPLDSHNWTCSTPSGTPQQNNGIDCGVFICQFAKHLAADEPIPKSLDIPALRELMCYEILKLNLI
uniref:RNA-directed DNA polymerase n=1 Tax=Lygus hesperus TaxID=30085 RepID=A0A0A9YJ44_LYGHE